MDEPVWLLWIVGPFFVVFGVFSLWKHKAVYQFFQNSMDRQGTPEKRRVDTFGDSRSIIFVAPFLVIIGAYTIYFAWNR